jgi:hypothetical protein
MGDQPIPRERVREEHEKQSRGSKESRAESRERGARSEVRGPRSETGPKHIENEMRYKV